MAFSKTERQGIVMGQHPTNSPENDSAFFKAGAADGCAVASSISSNSSCKLELLIGDMTIRIDAPSSHMGSYNLSIPLLTGGTVTSPPALYDNNVKPITVEAGEAASQAVTFVPLVQDQIEELASSTFWSCSLCSKYISTEASGLGGTYITESCGHQFCKDCHTNLVKKILHGVESECSQHFTQLDIKQAVGNSAFLHLQNALVGLFCCEFAAAWNKICPQCSTQDFAATLVPSTELEYLGLREVCKSIEAWGLQVSGQSKQHGLHNLEKVTGTLVTSPWHLICLTCDLVQCNACGLQRKGPASSSSAMSKHEGLAFNDFGIILQGREITTLASEEMIAPACSSLTDAPHQVCESRRKQCFSLFCAVMDINSAYEGLKHCLLTKESMLHTFGSSCSSKVHTKEAAIWPADGVKEKTDQDLRTSDYALSHELLVSQLLPHFQAQMLPLGPSEICGMQLRKPPGAVDGMPRMLLPAVEDLLSPQGSQHPVAAVSESVFLEQSPLEIVSGTHGQVSTTSTMESSNCSHAQIPDIDIPVVFPSLPAVPVNPNQEPLYFVIQGPRSLNFIDYWSYKRDTWSMASQYWGCEAERCAAAAAWCNMECSKWAGISNAMAQTASICASLEAHWTQSAERARLLHELWVFKFHEMSVWQVNLARSGIHGPPCSLTKSFPACQPTVQLLNLRRETDVDGYPDLISAETEWISAGGGEVELWSTASTAFVPSASLGSHSKTRASSPSSLDSPLDEGSSNVPEAVAANKLADERLANALWDLTNILEVDAAVGVGLPTLATFFLSGFKPLQEVLSFLLENRSLPDIMARESLYSEVLFLLQALSSHIDTVPILCMPISCPSMQSCQAHSSLFEALQSLHQRAGDMLSETLVRVDNEHDATRKNLNFIGDLEDAFDIVQASLEHLQTG